jgi:ubiquinone/menaquinone biosynthesis C-methylase UbiE
MNHADHLDLIRKGIPEPGGTWGELGSGRGAFTLALAELVGPNGTIYSIDQNPAVLNEQKHAVERHFGDQQPSIHYWTADYTQPLEIPALDGVLMANSLHFQRDKRIVLELVFDHLSPGGNLILVEYNLQKRNSWVPHPITFEEWVDLSQRIGFVGTSMLGVRPSRTMREIYSALCNKPD